MLLVCFFLGCGLTGLAIAPNGITILTDHLGRTAGDGFVQFTSADLVEQALKKHKEKIKHRWAKWLVLVWYIGKMVS